MQILIFWLANFLIIHFLLRSQELVLLLNARCLVIHMNDFNLLNTKAGGVLLALSIDIVCLHRRSGVHNLLLGAGLGPFFGNGRGSWRHVRPALHPSFPLN